MDPKPIPPSGTVEDLRNAPAAKTPEQLEAEKQAKHDKVRRNLRIIALCLAVYYFGSAGYSWYEESQYDANAVAEVNAVNPLRAPKLFRETFNGLINAADTSLPVATANDTTEGFVSVLSTALELKGYNKPQSTELLSVQIQTRYPDAFPPESIIGFRSFVLACERLADPNATQEQADALLEQVGLIPKVDANENDKHFPATTVRSNAYEYQTTFNAGPIDELTLVATPLANLAPATPETPVVEVSTSEQPQAPAQQQQPSTSAASAEAPAQSPAPHSAPSDDVPSLSEPSAPHSNSDVPSL